MMETPISLRAVLVLVLMYGSSCDKQSNKFDIYSHKCGISSESIENYLIIQPLTDGQAEIQATLHKSFAPPESLTISSRNCVLVPQSSSQQAMVQVTGISSLKKTGKILSIKDLEPSTVNSVHLDVIESKNLDLWLKCGYLQLAKERKLTTIVDSSENPILGKHLITSTGFGIQKSSLEISPLGCVQYQPQFDSAISIFSSQDINGSKDLFLSLDTRTLKLEKQSYKLCESGKTYDYSSNMCVEDEIIIEIPRSLKSSDEGVNFFMDQGVLIDEIKVALASKNQVKISIENSDCPWLFFSDENQAISGKAPFSSLPQCQFDIVAEFKNSMILRKNVLVGINTDSPPIWSVEPNFPETSLYLKQGLFPTVFQASDADTDSLSLSYGIEGESCDWIEVTQDPLQNSIRLEGSTASLNDPTQCQVTITATTSQGRQIKNSHTIKVLEREVCEPFSGTINPLPMSEVGNFHLTKEFQTKRDSQGRVHIIDIKSENEITHLIREFSTWKNIEYTKMSDEYPILVASSWNSEPTIILLSKTRNTMRIRRTSGWVNLPGIEINDDIIGVDSIQDPYGNIVIALATKDQLYDVFLKKEGKSYQVTSGSFSIYDLESQPSMVLLDNTVHLVVKQNHRIRHLLRTFPSSVGKWNVLDSFGTCINSPPSIAAQEINGLSVIVNRNSSLVSYEYRNFNGVRKWQEGVLLDKAAEGRTSYGNSPDNLINYIVASNGKQTRLYRLRPQLDSLTIQKQLLIRRFNLSCFHSEQYGSFPSRNSNAFDNLNFKNECRDDLVNFYGQLCYSGYEQACDGVEAAQDDIGQWWRSPRRERFSETNSFTNTIVPGVGLYFITKYQSANNVEKSKLRYSLKKWFYYISGDSVYNSDRCVPYGYLRKGHEANEWSLFVISKLWDYLEISDKPPALKNCTDYDQEEVIVDSLTLERHTISQFEHSINERLERDSTGVLRLAKNGWKVHYFSTINEVRKLVHDDNPKVSKISNKLYLADPGNLLYRYKYIRDVLVSSKEEFSKLRDDLLRTCDLNFNQSDRTNWRWERRSDNPGLSDNMMGWDCLFLTNLLERHSNKVVVSKQTMPGIADYFCNYYELFSPRENSIFEGVQRLGDFLREDPAEFVLEYLIHLYVYKALSVDEIINLANQMVLDKKLSTQDLLIERDKIFTFSNSSFYEQSMYPDIEYDHLAFYLNRVMDEYATTKKPRSTHYIFDPTKKESCIVRYLSEPYLNETIEQYRQSLEGSYTNHGYIVVD